ncbi:MAG: hypothetical protein LBL28_03495 [Treponema sp.]|jgi:hypothetical protein|nr:hypothetical protein [Treponema sp.]
MIRKLNSNLNRFQIFCLLGLVLFSTCGIDDYIYLYPVQESAINVRLVEEATVTLPPAQTSEGPYFTHFVIYYRIYISELRIDSVTPDIMRTVNTALSNDYNAIYPSTSNNSSSTSVNTNVGSLFSTRRYYELALDGTNIESLLDDTAQGQTLTISFPNQINVIPSLSRGGGTAYNLRRSNGSNTFNPQPPTLNFINTAELNRPENAIPTVNADVADQQGISGPRYAYVSLYIVKIGRDTNTLSTIYSAPTFIGVLRLPNDS